MNNIKKQSGMSLIGAIFVMVILSSLGLFMMKLNIMQHTSSAMSLQASRAYYAAESGLEWVTAYIRRPGAANSCPPLNGVDPNQTPYTLSLNNFTITIVNCVAGAQITEGNQQYTLFDVQILAEPANTQFGDMEYSSRRIEATVVGNMAKAPLKLN